MRLADVVSFRVSDLIIAATERVLRDSGQQGYEAFVLWTGTQHEQDFFVQTAHVPRQSSYQLESGLCVCIDGEELHRLNMWLFNSGEVLAAQVHAHPSEAYHSDTDSAFPIVTTLGGLSIVAADFCQPGLLAESTAIYRLELNGWVLQSLNLIEVV